MAELRGFWEFTDSDEELAPEVQEVVDFLSKMDYEGGLDGYYGWGGSEQFPPELRKLAKKYGEAMDALESAIESWANARGVQL